VSLSFLPSALYPTGQAEKIATKAQRHEGKPLVNNHFGVLVAKMFCHKMQKNYN
jgi:hypothetical protein